MPKLRLFAVLPLVLLAGCHQTRRSGIAITITPASSGESITVTCNASTSDKCHLAFTGNASPSLVTLEAGASASILQVAVGTEYCAEAHSVTLDTCRKSPILLNRQTVTKQTSSDARSD